MSRKHRNRYHKYAREAYIPDEYRESKVMKQISSQRSDSTDAMKRITTSGWSYSEEDAKRHGTSDVGYYVSEVHDVRITPEDALELYSHHNYRYNRAFNQEHATQLSKDIRTAPGLAIAIGPSGMPEFVNGQHTLWAIYMRNETTDAVVVVYQCRDEQSIARLFAIFDSNRIRTNNNVIDAAKLSGDLDDCVSTSKQSKCAQFVSSAENDFNRPCRQETNTHKIQRIKREDVMAFTKWFESLTKDKNIKKLFTQGIGAAFFAMFKSDEKKATEFVSSYVDGVGLSQNSPVLKLREMMINRREGEHASSVCRFHAEFVYSAWKKFCMGEELQSLRRTQTLPDASNWKIFISPSMSSETIENRSEVTEQSKAEVTLRDNSKAVLKNSYISFEER